ncbi:MAG TPA: hypothetical protein VK158_05915 [Acidobacteriota bacterium]|nr:hypothetical protein [Acidobacteriota bacterium]
MDEEYQPSDDVLPEETSEEVSDDEELDGGEGFEEGFYGEKKDEEQVSKLDEDEQVKD